VEYQKRCWFAAITENTGAHFLDSGSAYGRHWERNAKLTPETAFNWDYRLNVQSYGWDVTINVLHFLTENYTIDRVQTSRFHRFGHTPAMKWEHWQTILEEYVTSRGGTMGRGFNTYNDDNWLSQCVHTQHYTNANDEDFIAVSVHTGCDIRGGYSRPYICRSDESEWNVGLMDGWMGCRNGHNFYADGWRHWICDDPHNTHDQDDFKVRHNGKAYWLACPICGCKVDM